MFRFLCPGVFVAKGDVGTGTIVGSAVFNILFVIGLCGCLAKAAHLNWWPVFRDSSFYALAVLILTGVCFTISLNVVCF